MYLKAITTPASAPGGHVWEDESAVVEVPDALGNELIRMPHQFSEVLPGSPEHPGFDAEDLIGDAEDEGDDDEKKPCGKEGCKNNAKAGQDFCHWHGPKKTPIQE